jgi:hypothetical protein
MSVPPDQPPTTPPAGGRHSGQPPAAAQPPASEPPVAQPPVAQPVAQPVPQPVAQPTVVQPPVAQPVAQPPANQPHAVPPPVFAAVPQPAAAAPVPVRPTTPRLSLDAGRYWAGVAATAVVAALVGIVGVVVFDAILDVNLTYKDPFGTDSVVGAYVVGGAVGAVVAGGLLHLLVISTPRPRRFFGWIVGLATLVATLLPFAWTDDTTRAVCSGAVNMLVGIAIWSLLAGVYSRTVRRV